MRNLIYVAMLSILLMNCKENGIVDNSLINEESYDQPSMEMSVASVSNPFSSTYSAGNNPSVIMHDSLRHERMFLRLKVFLNLTDLQVDTIKIFANTLFDELKAIREQVVAGTIAKDSAKVLVNNARLAFVDSVKSVLNEEQKVKFERWLIRFWHRRHHHGRH